uniref:NADH dehydrogenase subunit 5 n=1 Tax=Phyllotreta striolata TaxID=444603 RepID=UPI0013B3D81C|nr:NADH dehydrogenase subunit 5 [Phyllotreta striolata]QHR79688.1 NADH dehydrogenase subunit 5 [Phyllotreta striolata]UPE50058.1 NADH dehydrogenase subunit 5 [Phyllotreta striolata]WDV10359.1 NADH dehydrogenase subunit 5 [Phyllotreta striolata]
MLFLISLVLFLASLKFLVNNMVYLVEFNLMTVYSVNIEYIMLFDWMSLMFMSYVLFISSMIMNYSNYYMQEDKYKPRFFFLVLLFILSMMMMILSPNLISILLGWDGLGLVSYCLVIYYQNVKSFNAGMLTALTNRLGDAALLLAMAWIVNYGSFNFMFYLDYMNSDSYMGLISYLIIIAAFTKSAQIPFSAWLPAAMSAPTPVSSLVHSSTLVTAGVYLIMRFYIIFNQEVLLFILFISSLTMFMAGLGANFEFDLKKIIALSTLSQLGLMMSILALGGLNLAYFHLLTHAIFKALLFMCAGNIIHSFGDCQDIRFMGGLMKHLPLTCTFFNLCNWALCGLPFMSGFYSKDLIVEFMSMSVLNSYIYIIFYVSIGLTVSYSVRLSFYVLVHDFKFLSLNLLVENSKMLISMGVLVFFVVFNGSLLSWFIFENLIFICLPCMMKMFTIMWILVGVWCGYEVSLFLVSSKFIPNMVSMFLSSMWCLPNFSTISVNYYPIYSSHSVFKSIDQGWLEYYGGLNLSAILRKVMILQLFSKNYFKIYLFILMMFMMILIF